MSLRSAINEAKRGNILLATHSSSRWLRLFLVYHPGRILPSYEDRKLNQYYKPTQQCFTQM